MNRQQKIALGVAVYAASRSKTSLGFIGRLIAIWFAAFVLCFLLGAGIVVWQGLSVSHQGAAVQTK